MSDQQQTNAFERMHLDTFSMRPYQGSVQGISDTDDDSTSFIPQDPAAQAAQRSQRILDFLAGEQAYSYRRRESVPDAQARMARSMQDFDVAWERASSRRATA